MVFVMHTSCTAYDTQCQNAWRARLISVWLGVSPEINDSTADKETPPTGKPKGSLTNFFVIFVQQIHSIYLPIPASLSTATVEVSATS